MNTKHYLYRRPQRPLWAPAHPVGTTYNITYKPNPGPREEVIKRFEHIVQLIRTSFGNNPQTTTH